MGTGSSISKAGSDRVWRAGSPHQHDGEGGGQSQGLADTPGLPRLPGGYEPDSWPKLDRNGHPRWQVRAGWRGLLVAGISFILPAALMVGCLAWAYVRYGALPKIGAVLYGMKPVVIVAIAQGAFRLAKSAVKSTWLGVLGVVATIAAALGVDPLLTFAWAGVLAAWLVLGSAAGGGLILWLGLHHF